MTKLITINPYSLLDFISTCIINITGFIAQFIRCVVEEMCVLDLPYPLFFSMCWHSWNSWNRVAMLACVMDVQKE